MTDIKAKEIQLVPLSEIKLNPKNRNKHPKEQIARAVEIIRYQGFRRPVTISKRTGLLVCGEGRFLAAKRLRMKELPAMFQDYESEEQEFADAIADNALDKWSDLDHVGIIQDIEGLSTDFNLDMMGIRDFEMPETEFVPQADEDEIPTPPPDPHTKRGDVYILGRHRLMCGDSTSATDVEKLLDGRKADMVFTDPPYGVDYEGGHNKKKRSKIKNDTLAGDELTDLFADSLSLAHAFTHDHAAFYVWYANGKVVETMASFKKLALKIRAVICWYKVRSGLGAFMAQYIPNYEPCIYAHKEGCSPQWFGPTDEKTVWELKREKVNEYHPTQKPVELAARAMANSSKAGQLVLDLFGGSGATLIAAEKSSRDAALMELDPWYCDVIVARWEKYTGQKAELLR